MSGAGGRETAGRQRTGLGLASRRQRKRCIACRLRQNISRALARPARCTQLDRPRSPRRNYCPAAPCRNPTHTWSSSKHPSSPSAARPATVCSPARSHPARRFLPRPLRAPGASSPQYLGPGRQSRRQQPNCTYGSLRTLLRNTYRRRDRSSDMASVSATCCREYDAAHRVRTLRELVRGTNRARALQVALGSAVSARQTLRRRRVSVLKCGQVHGALTHHQAQD